MDAFFTRIYPYSKSISTLKFVYHKCNSTFTHLIPPAGISLLGTETERPLCLRKPVLGVLHQDIALELSITGKIQKTNCSLGTVKMHSQLCVSGINSHNVFQLCDGVNNTQMVWESKIDVTSFQFSSNRTLIMLPGKLIDSQFHLEYNSCHFVILLKYRWKKIEQTERSKQVSKQMFLITPRSTKSKSSTHSWLQADRMCLEKGFKLPVLLSQNEETSIIQYLKDISISFLVTNVFVGIHKKVLKLNLSEWWQTLCFLLLCFLSTLWWLEHKQIWHW